MLRRHSLFGTMLSFHRVGQICDIVCMAARNTGWNAVSCLPNLDSFQSWVGVAFGTTPDRSYKAGRLKLQMDLEGKTATKIGEAIGTAAADFRIRKCPT